MKKVLKEVAGIDVAQKELVVSLGRLYESLDVEIIAYKVFKNTDNGIKSLIDWVADHGHNTDSVRYVMKATGVYHEKLAYVLDESGFDLSVVLPNKISNFFRTLDINTITDKTASQAIMRFGLERKLENWSLPKKLIDSSSN
ncbi:IS110 family transposase [Gelidibacter japonicus]|uniref:IS110 family transposase n=1 Tax=Gelidibacter japonicus TaxID=1962232 RepID=UPI003A945901